MDVRGFVKIPKRLSTKTPGIYSFCPGQTGQDFLFEKIKKCLLNGIHNYKSNCSSYRFKFYRKMQDIGINKGTKREF